MRYMGMAAGISSWWGVGSASDSRIPNQLRAADGTPFRWALYYELEGPQYPDPSPARSAATWPTSEGVRRGPELPAHRRQAGAVRVGRPDDRCGMNARWKAANTLGFHVVLKRFQSFATCKDQPQSWHDYGPASRVLDNRPWSVSVSPASGASARPGPPGPRPGRWHAALKR
jgi:hypothetical protein